MADIERVFYVNAAQAVNQGVSGSDALKATTICMIEDSDGGLHIGSATTFDTTDDGERQAAAFAVTSAQVPAGLPADEAAEAQAEAEPAPVEEPTPEPAPPAIADVATAPDGTTETDVEVAAEIPATEDPAPADAPVTMAAAGPTIAVDETPAPADELAPADPTPPAPKGK